MSRRDRWFRIEVDGSAVLHVQGWKDAQIERRRLERRYGKKRVSCIEETPT